MPLPQTYLVILVPFHIRHWPKVKLGKVGIDSWTLCVTCKWQCFKNWNLLKLKLDFHPLRPPFSLPYISFCASLPPMFTIFTLVAHYRILLHIFELIWQYIFIFGHITLIHFSCSYWELFTLIWPTCNHHYFWKYFPYLFGHMCQYDTIFGHIDFVAIYSRIYHSSCIYMYVYRKSCFWYFTLVWKVYALIQLLMDILPPALAWPSTNEALNNMISWIYCIWSGRRII